MTPFRHAKLESADPRGVVLGLDGGWRMRVALVAPGVGRTLLLPATGLREPHTWSVIDGQARDPWQGAARSALFADAPAATLTRSGDSITLADELLRVHIALSPPRLTWEQWNGSGWQTCCTDRPTFGYGSAARSGLTGHWQQRDEHDQYFGLGDKTGPLNKAGRRFRTRALDALGYNGESSDPLYKHWPFFIGRRADSGACYGVFYDTLAECTFDFGQEFDNYHGFYRATEIADGDLDCYVLAGPDVAGALARFVGLIGGTAMPPRWSLGYANTAMALADVPDAQARIAEFLATAKRLQFPLSSFHFGSGYTSRGNRRYVFTWNRDKFPDPAGLLRAFRDAGVRTVANIKPCLLDDHPAFAAVAAAGGFIREEGGAVCLDPFWDGWGAHLDFTRDGDRHWWQDNLQHQVLEVGFDAGWNDNNEYPIWSETGMTHGGGQPLPIHRSRPLHPMLMTEATAETATRVEARRAHLHDHARGRTRHSAHGANLVGRQHHQLAHAALESAHGADDEPVGHVQHRPRHRRLLRADARRGVADPLDAGLLPRAAHDHELVEGRRQRQHALAAPRSDRHHPQRGAAAAAPDAHALHADVAGRHTALPRAAPDLLPLRR